MLPRLSDIRRDETHRLVPASTVEEESVLTRLTDDPDDLNALFELEGATNDRLLGEAGLLPGITLHELVFGFSYAHVVNAAFTHASPLGSRFNGPERGAWYAAFSLQTSELEVAYHKGKELQEIDWRESETFPFVDFLADFRGVFHDVRDDPSFSDCLDPDRYETSQRLAVDLLHAGSAGIVYPSVRDMDRRQHRPDRHDRHVRRHRRGTCLACFRPALVNNVRKGRSISITFEHAFARPDIRDTA